MPPALEQVCTQYAAILSDAKSYGTVYEQAIAGIAKAEHYRQRHDVFVRTISSYDIVIEAALLHGIGNGGDLVYDPPQFPKQNYAHKGFLYCCQAAIYHMSNGELLNKKCLPAAPVAILIAMQTAYTSVSRSLTDTISTTVNTALHNYLQKLAWYVYAAGYNNSNIDKQIIRMTLCLGAILNDDDSDIEPLVQALWTYYSEHPALMIKPVFPVACHGPGTYRTQTEALLAMPLIQLQLLALPALQTTPLRTMINSMLTREQEYGEAYGVFYHGVDLGIYIGHLFLQAYTHCNDPTKNNTSRHHMTLRAYNVSCNTRYTSVDEILEENLRTYGHICDEPHYTAKLLQKKFACTGTTAQQYINNSMRGKLLAVNLAIFGNINRLGESSLQYFLTSKRLYTNLAEFYAANILASSVLDKPKPEPTVIEHYAAELMALYKRYRSKTPHGALYQIFIPKEHIDTIAYLSRSLGIPYINPTLFAYLRDPALTTSNKLAAFATFTTADQQEAYTYTPLSKVIHTLTHNPETLVHAVNLQARILVDSEVFVNPVYGVELHAYTSLPLAAQTALEQAVTDLATSFYSGMTKIRRITRAHK